MAFKLRIACLILDRDHWPLGAIPAGGIERTYVDVFQLNELIYLNKGCRISAGRS